MKTLAIINTLPASETVATFTYELKKELLSSKDIFKSSFKMASPHQYSRATINGACRLNFFLTYHFPSLFSILLVYFRL